MRFLDVIVILALLIAGCACSREPGYKEADTSPRHLVARPKADRRFDVYMWDMPQIQDGELCTYYSTGVVRQRFRFKDYWLHGPYEHAFENGTPQLTGTFDHSRPVGKWTFFYRNGQKRSQGMVKHKPVLASPKLFFHWNYLDRIGEWSFWNEQGELVETRTFTPAEWPRYEQDRARFD